MKQNIAGYQIDAYTRDEAQADLKAAMGHNLSQTMREWYRGIKLIKLPNLTGVATGASLTLPTGSDDPVACGPQQGYLWRIGRVTVTSSGSDVGSVSLYAGSDTSATDQAHLIDSTLKVGAAYYPGSRGLFLLPGEQLYVSLASVANNSYRLTGIAVEVPAEMVAKVL